MNCSLVGGGWGSSERESHSFRNTCENVFSGKRTGSFFKSYHSHVQGHREMS